MRPVCYHIERMKRAIIPDNKIYMLDYTPARVDGKARIVHARAVRLSDGKAREWSGADCTENILQDLTNFGAAFVFVWDMSVFGAYCDYYALSRNMPHFDDAEKQKSGNGVAEPCYNALYTGQHGMLFFRVTLRRTAKTHEYGSGRIGGLHTVEYRGLSPYFGVKDIQEAAADLGINSDGAERVRALYIEWTKAYLRFTGEEFAQTKILRRVYTAGGCAKRLYLQIKYGKNKDIRAYHKEFWQQEDMDDYLRDRRLLLSGMCFFPDENRGKLFELDLVKYDANGLYSFVANAAGTLGYPEESDYKTFQRDKSGKYAYIIIVKNTLLLRRKNMPNCFSSPFNRLSGNIVEIPEEWAVFGELWRALDMFYQREEFDIVKVLRAEKKPDPAIIQYNNFFVSEKQQAKKISNHTLYLITKIFLNSLPGKFLQTWRYVECVPTYDATADAVIFDRGKIKDNWERGHFHFLRGAYIYTLARVKIMQDMAALFALADEPIKHHFYTDTDSIVTDIKMPAEWLDAFELGKYKIEEKYLFFGVICPKTYYGYTSDGRHKLTCAGLKKNAVLQEIYDSYGALSPPQEWEALTAATTFTLSHYARISGGAIMVNTPVKLGDIKNIIDIL